MAIGKISTDTTHRGPSAIAKLLVYLESVLTAEQTPRKGWLVFVGLHLFGL